jgi:hypothetical protein
VITSTERTVHIRTRSGKQFLVKENGEIRTINSNEKCGLMIGLVHRPSHVLTLLPAVFSMVERLSAGQLLRQLASCSCTDEPNSWQVMIEASGNGEIVVWPEEESVNGLRVMRRKGLAA